MRLNIYGDLTPSESNIEHFKNGNASAIFGGVQGINNAGDYNIVNLETAVADQLRTVDKSGPQMVAPLKMISVLKDAGFHVLSVANNHAMDNGLESFTEMLKEIGKHGMQYVGAVRPNENADRLMLKNDNVSVGVLSLGDHEFNTADKQSGINIFRNPETYSDIADLSRECDITVVLYHSGAENYQYPSPDLRRRCRMMRDAGAQIVICQHSHCIGTSEIYHDGLIVYGQGNFLFDKTKRATWHEGLVVQVCVGKDGWTYELLPVTVEKGQVYLATAECAREILAGLSQRSDEVRSEKFLAAMWQKFLREETWKYNAMLMGGTRLAYVLAKLLSKVKGGLMLSKRQKKNLLLLLQSETHTEILTALLESERRQ